MQEELIAQADTLEVRAVSWKRLLKERVEERHSPLNFDLVVVEEIFEEVKHHYIGKAFESLEGDVIHHFFGQLWLASHED